jgi:hypothetical protein
MNDLSGDQWVNIAASMLAAVACITFAITYHLRATWWRSNVGRNQMAFAASIAALCIFTVLTAVWIGDECILMALRIWRTAVLVAVAALMVQRTRLLIKAQRESRDRTGV